MTNKYIRGLYNEELKEKNAILNMLLQEWKVQNTRGWHNTNTNNLRYLEQSKIKSQDHIKWPINYVAQTNIQKAIEIYAQKQLLNFKLAMLLYFSKEGETHPIKMYTNILFY